MNSMADILAKAGLVTQDEATVAKRLRQDIQECRRELRGLRESINRGWAKEEGRERLRVLEARLRVLTRTKVAKCA